MNCWEAFYVQTFHQHSILISEQQVNDTNPLYELANMLPIPLQALWISRTQHSEQYTHHTYGKSILLTYIYPFTFIIIHFAIYFHYN